ncbi:MAG TPA: TlpA disulfide reductase family protein, partial [Pyrinomonadaceae bacterium]|nr:TlpA disulfide reductase family protein [Pyrinomonadaceae bacterium]
MILNLSSRTKRSAWFAVLPLLLCCIGVHPQSKATAGTSDQSEVTLSSDLINQELTTLYNRQLKLADYPGKITIINVFASWCAPCRQNLWDLIKIKQKYGGHGVEVIGLVVPESDPDIAAVRRFVRLQQINFPVVWDEKGFGASLVKAMKGQSVLPQTFIIGEDGRILKHFQGFDSKHTPVLMREVLDQAGKEGKRTG